MTFEAIIQYQQAMIFGNQSGLPKFIYQQKQLRLHVEANTQSLAEKEVKGNWRKIRRRLPYLKNALLMALNEITVCCPQCGASELAFCSHK